MVFLQSIFSKLSGTAWAVLGAIAAAGAFFLQGLNKGVQRERRNQNELENESLRTRLEVSEDVNSMSDGDIDSQLREYIKKRDG